MPEPHIYPDYFAFFASHAVYDSGHHKECKVRKDCLNCLVPDWRNKATNYKDMMNFMEKINEFNPVKLYFISISGFTQHAKILLKEKNLKKNQIMTIQTCICTNTYTLNHSFLVQAETKHRQ